MNWIPVENSQAMSAYAYDPASYTLGIKTAGGMPYFYVDVPPDVHARFTQAPSKGKFWITEIKTKFQCRKGDGELAQQSPKATEPVHPKVAKIIEVEGEKVSTALVQSTAALEKEIVSPFTDQVADLRRKMANHCLSIHLEVGELSKAAIHTTVTDEESFTKAAELGTKLAARRKGVTVMMKPTKQAIDQVKQVVLDKEQELLGLAEQGESHLKKLCTDYRTEQQRIVNDKAATERKRLLREAENNRIAQAETAQAAGKTGLAEKLLDTPVTAPTVKVEQAVPKVAGVSARVNYRWRLTPGTDITRLPLEWLQLNESVIGKYARDSKHSDGTIVQGVEFYQEPDTNF